MIAIAPTLIGALLGALFGYLMQNLLAMRATDIKRIDDHVAEIGVIEKLAMDYWLEDGSDDPDEERVSAARLRSALAVTMSFEETARRIFAKKHSAYEALDLDLFERATGGPFETVNRKADPERAIDTAVICHAMRDKLRSQRRHLYWTY